MPPPRQPRRRRWRGAGMAHGCRRWWRRRRRRAARRWRTCLRRWSRAAAGRRWGCWLRATRRTRRSVRCCGRRARGGLAPRCWRACTCARGCEILRRAGRPPPPRRRRTWSTRCPRCAARCCCCTAPKTRPARSRTRGWCTTPRVGRACPRASSPTRGRGTNWRRSPICATRPSERAAGSWSTYRRRERGGSGRDCSLPPAREFV
mmetsp:Transcript_43281/g.138998  ORF Transcript_43281/g.138998 Transcript_43281/m.138998 type:complete len:205 (-) Transcript_43281:48-662(-)